MGRGHRADRRRPRPDPQNGIALLTVEVPGLDVVTAGLAAADDLIAATAPEVAAAGTAVEASGDALQGYWSAMAGDVVQLASSRVGPKGAKGADSAEEGGLPKAFGGTVNAIDDAERPLTKATQVEYGSEEMSQAAQKARVENGWNNRRNVSVYEITHDDKSTELIPDISNGRHGERRVADS